MKLVGEWDEGIGRVGCWALLRGGGERETGQAGRPTRPPGPPPGGGWGGGRGSAGSPSVQVVPGSMGRSAKPVMPRKCHEICACGEVELSEEANFPP